MGRDLASALTCRIITQGLILPTKRGLPFHTIQQIYELYRRNRQKEKARTRSWEGPFRLPLALEAVSKIDERLLLPGFAALFAEKLGFSGQACPSPAAMPPALSIATKLVCFRLSGGTAARTVRPLIGK